MLSLMKTVIPQKTKMNQDEGFASIGDPFFKPASRARGITSTKISCGMFRKLLTISVRPLIVSNLMNSLLWRKIRPWPWWNSVWCLQVCRGVGSQFLFNASSICWKEVPFLNNSPKVERSLPPRPPTLRTMQCIRCGKTSLYNKVSEVCMGLKWVSENRNRDIDNMHCWRDRFMGGSYLQRVVDVEKDRTLIWCRKSTGWTTSSRLVKRLRNHCKGQREYSNKVGGAEQLKDLVFMDAECQSPWVWTSLRDSWRRHLHGAMWYVASNGKDHSATQRRQAGLRSKGGRVRRTWTCANKINLLEKGEITPISEGRMLTATRARWATWQAC